MARRRKKDSDPFEFAIVCVPLAVLLAIADPRIRNALVQVGIVILWLTVFLAVFALFLGIAFLLKRRSTRTTNDPQVRPVEIATAQANQSESDDSRYMPKESARVDDSRYMPKHTKPISEQLRAIDWFQFEKLMALAYSGTGVVTRKGRANPDGGIDLVLERQGEKIGIQCKHWRTRMVGVKVVRELIGAMVDAGIKKGIIVSLNPYSQDAVDLAGRHNVELVDENGVVGLLKYLNQAEVQAILSDTRKICPRCEQEMVIRTSRNGDNVGDKFWGCLDFPRCRQTLPFEVS